MKLHKLKLTLPSNASELMKRVYDNGYEIYAVGGFVRDSILLRDEKGDIDFTTNMRPEEVKTLFNDCRVIETGIKNGTVTVIFGGVPFEITTYRSDGEYEDSRHPNDVSFVSSLDGDLSRRDFTMNALCYFERENSNEYEYGIIDMFDGMGDIKNHIIKTIGDPLRRFNEDALRILRSYRFMASLDFTIADDVRAASKKAACSLNKISKERKTAEIMAVLRVTKPSKALSALYEDGVLNSLFGESFSIDENSLLAIDSAKDRSVRLYILLGRQAEVLLSCLSLERRVIDNIRLLSLEGENPLIADKVELKKTLFRLKKEKVDMLFDYQKAVQALSDFQAIYNLLEEIYENGECYSLKQLKINGDDIKLLLNETDGALIGKALDSLLFDVIGGRIYNNRETLIEAIKKDKLK